MKGYAVIIEGDGDAFSAYVPDLPGCVAAGASVAEVEALIAEAIWLHVDLLAARGEPIPPPTAASVTVVKTA